MGSPSTASIRAPSGYDLVVPYGVDDVPVVAPITDDPDIQIVSVECGIGGDPPRIAAAFGSGSPTLPASREGEKTVEDATVALFFSSPLVKRGDPAKRLPKEPE